MVYVAHVERQYVFRALGDESFFAPDIVAGLQTGHIGTVYPHGSLYQVGSVSVLTVVGGGYRYLQWLSPVVGVVAFAMILFAGYALTKPHYRGMRVSVFVMLGLVPLLFPSFVIRMIESTHKTYTYILFMTLLLSISVVARSDRPESYLLLWTGILAVSISSYIHTTIFMLFFAPLLVLTIYRRDSFIDGVTFVVSGWVIVITVAFFLPTIMVDGFQGWVISVISDFLESISEIDGTGERNIETLTRGGTGAETGISTRTRAWPTIQILGISISVWFLYSLGVVVSAAMSAVGVAVATKRYLRGDCTEWPLQDALYISSVTYGGLICVSLLGGDIATAKRLINIPGILGVAFFAVVLDGWLDVARGYRELALKCILGVLLVTTLVAVPLGTERVLLDGGSKPYDHFLSEHEVEKVSWVVANYRNLSTVATFKDNDRYASEKISGVRICVLESVPRNTNIVYDNNAAADGRVAYLESPYKVQTRGCRTIS